MTVRLYRPRSRRRARILLSVAVLLPAAGLFQVSGLNPLSVVTAAGCSVLCVWIAVDALLPSATISRHGILIRGGIGRGPDAVSWAEITNVEDDHGIVSLTSRSRVLYQIETDLRSAQFLSRMVLRSVTASR